MKKNIKNERVFDGMVKVLTVFKGYTVDVRLGQFRKANPAKKELEFIDFSSPQGSDLLEEYLGTQDKNSAELRQAVAYYLRR